MFISSIVCLLILGTSPATANTRVIAHSQDFPKGAGPENVVLSPSGNDIITAIGTIPRIYQVPAARDAAPKLIHEFTDAFGVSSLAPGPESNVYYAITGNYSYGTLTPTPASYRMHRLALDAAGHAVVQDLPFLDSIAQPNGMIHVPGTQDLLIADCSNGLVFRYNTATYALTTYFDDPLLKAQPEDGFAFGVNGIKLSRGYLYFSNTNQGLVARVRATGLESKLEGTPEVIATGVPVDDFIVNSFNGDVFMALNTANALGYIAHDANTTSPTVILGGANSTQLMGPTAAIWASGAEGRELIIPITGGFLQYVEQNFTGGARIDLVHFGKYL